MTDHDTLKLAGCAAELIRRVGLVLDAMTAIGYPMMVTDGLRTVGQQQALYALGRTSAGAIVTNADGLPVSQGGHGRSNHQAAIDGFGHACDCAFVVNGSPSWDARLPWKAYGAIAEALGLKWGGDWAALHDLPHVELP